jgi:2-dehydro-3-deoxyphosphooctonate aldolase (KDO 8-P synthase)
MKENGCPIVYDASHSVQKPGANKGVSSGDSKFISPLAKAAVAIGIDGLFIETHPNPESAISDGDNSLNINQIEGLLKQIVNIDSTIRKGV